MSVDLENVSCAICGSHTTKPLYKKYNLFISSCQKCGLVYANPRLSKSEIWDRYSPNYFWQEYLPSLGVQKGQYDLDFFDARYGGMLRLIASYSQPPGRLLEVGTGAGFFLKAAQRAGWDVAGIEVSDAGVDFAKTQLHLDVRQQAAEEISFADNTFDVVVMFDVIEHLLDPQITILSLRRVLRDKGILIIATPNFKALSRLALGRDWAVLSPKEHLYYFTQKTLTNFLSKNRFDNIYFVKNFSDFGVFETMNPRYTHAPNSWRTKAYLKFVERLGSLVFRPIQNLGLGDTLLCVAQAC
ncbi:MAG TPA: hypothetical protein DEG17_11825 [Cyanobacteria bacterium UBA11149]|nr:hypothetical protein [Cyanobacteria bacterium UBA11367]HBE59790.1 hypothetical protein [Cyanobacteria bacterium UBA11366]HBK64277.1 hypothetical protein [Cyanobacteria bacterium UBA11166]HBR72365.1 hypothetical protein [Cyanobacteria bacterium UBA11159]HBS70850.1 hypothetical protein [Cyanobacteria bacterium UBA11153]HBW89534.1 hypothetical protein [Cyanobacteria bacterium UBA11149]HCA94281.1 hypothetical protein [Cyanobacteria bacterium UBA9226]